LSHTLFTAPAESVLKIAPLLQSAYQWSDLCPPSLAGIDFLNDPHKNHVLGRWVARAKHTKTAAAHVALLHPHFIHWIIIHPDHRRKGLASALIGRMVKDADLKIVQAICRDATDKERAFYRKLGFSETLTY